MSQRVCWESKTLDADVSGSTHEGGRWAVRLRKKWKMLLGSGMKSGSGRQGRQLMITFLSRVMADHHPAGSPLAGECTPGRGEQCSLWTSSCRQRLRGHSALGSQSRS